jgi:envelope integrity protein B
MRPAALGAAIFIGAANIAAMPVHLVPNRATYDLRLEHTSPGGAVAARGRMVIQFRDTCDGWSTAQRMVADMTNADGATTRTDFLVTAWESKDGRSMRFDVKSASGGKLDKEKRGTAAVADDGSIAVSLLSPVRRQFELPAGTIFPSQQTIQLASAASRGQATVKRLVFQGGDEGDLYVSTAVIGHGAPADATAAERATDRAGLLKNVSAWTMLVSYFANKRAADLPEYEVASRLYANGISGSMSLIYTRYTLRATLSRLEPLLPVCSSDLSSPADESKLKGR